MPGPKPSAARKALRELFAEWSDRTFATYYGAWCQLAEMKQLGGITEDEQRDIILLCTARTTALTSAKFARIAEAQQRSTSPARTSHDHADRDRALPSLRLDRGWRLAVCRPAGRTARRRDRGGRMAPLVVTDGLTVL
jgi:hypothetical protein